MLPISGTPRAAALACVRRAGTGSTPRSPIAHTAPASRPRCGSDSSARSPQGRNPAACPLPTACTPADPPSRGPALRRYPAQCWPPDCLPRSTRTCRLPARRCRLGRSAAGGRSARSPRRGLGGDCRARSDRPSQGNVRSRRTRAGCARQARQRSAARWSCGRPCAAGGGSAGTSQHSIVPRSYDRRFQSRHFQISPHQYGPAS